jgi:hypothetical protein
MNLFTLGVGVGAYLGYRATRAPRGTGARRYADLGFEEAPDLEVAPLDVDALDVTDEEPEVSDDDRAVADGQNWIEALETSAIENGATPGRPLDDIVDDEEILRPPHRSSRRDTPVADLGSGGRRGR